MFLQENIRNKIKLLIKVNYNATSKNFKISKISPVVSQYGVEDTNLLDLQISSILDNFLLDGDFKVNEFYIPILIILFRDETETELFLLPPSQQELLKFCLDNKFKVTKYYLFILSSLGGGSIYLFNKSNYNWFINFLKTLKGKFSSFKNRDFLRSRKINFRRKIKKDGYSDV